MRSSKAAVLFGARFMGVIVAACRGRGGVTDDGPLALSALVARAREAAGEAVQRFLADNAADKHGVHRYTFAATGLDVDATRRRTARYERYFTVPREEL